MKQTISAIYYKCPVCDQSSTSKQNIEQHFYKEHPIKAEEVIYCKICGAGWYVNAYGRARAQEKAKECFKKHIETGEMDEVGKRAFFLSKGVFGFTRILTQSEIEEVER